MDEGKKVVDDPDAELLPHGCISAPALLTLASALKRLDDAHFEAGGKYPDAPCLRRIESADGRIVAHIASGPAIGGSWMKLIFQPHILRWTLDK